MEVGKEEEEEKGRVSRSPVWNNKKRSSGTGLAYFTYFSFHFDSRSRMRKSVRLPFAGLLSSLLISQFHSCGGSGLALALTGTSVNVKWAWACSSLYVLCCSLLRRCLINVSMFVQ